MARRVLVRAWLSLLLVGGGAANAATLLVPDEFPTIQSAINSASNGDTVFIRAGSYTESLTWANKDLVLCGSGADSTFLTTGSSARVLSLGPGITRQSVLCNLCLREGSAAEGGGIKFIGGSVLVQNCCFKSNVATRDTVEPMGGAAFVDAASRPMFENCLFLSNRSEPPWPQVDPPGLGGAIYVEAQGDVEVRGCAFQDNVAYGFEGGVGGGIYVDISASIVIDRCDFLENLGYGGGVFSRGAVSVTRCTFRGNAGYLGAAIYFPYGSYLVENSVFFENEIFGNESGTILTLGPGEIRSNTVAFNIGRDYGGIHAPQATITRNIISHNQGWGVIECATQSFACNDVWGNEINGVPANYECNDMTGINGNISANPLFCDPASDDYWLQPGSPCAPTSSPPGCGLIGALPAGCGVADISGESVSTNSVRLLVRPNPVSEVAEFFIDDNVRSQALEIFDAVGRLVDLISPIAPRMRWTLGRSAHSGVYFARLRGDGVNRIVKFVVVR